MTVQEWLAHPIVTLLIGALVTGILVPFITNRWQDRKKELEIKTSLIDQINEAVSKFMAEIESTEDILITRDKNKIDRHYAIKQREDLRKASTAWMTSDSLIKVKIFTYFPASQLNRKWPTFSKILNTFQDIALLDTQDHRVECKMKIKKYLTKSEKFSDWDGIGCKRSDDAYSKSWKMLKECITDEKNQIIKKIVAEPFYLFSGNTLNWIRSLNLEYGIILGLLYAWSVSIILVIIENQVGLPIGILYTKIGLILGIQDITIALCVGFSLHLVVGSLTGGIFGAVGIKLGSINIRQIRYCILIGIGQGIATWLLLFLPSLYIYAPSLIDEITVMHYALKFQTLASTKSINSLLNNLSLGIILIHGGLGVVFGFVIRYLIKRKDLYDNKPWTSLIDWIS